MNSLFIFDLDDTLFRITAHTKLLNKNGKVLKYLTAHELEHYQLKNGQKLDFSEFESSEKFFNESEPIYNMINKLKKIHNKIIKSNGSRIIINTSRKDLDDKEQFLQTFRIYDINIDDIHVERSGNLKFDEVPKKVQVIEKYIERGNYSYLCMYDDIKTNLDDFLSMQKNYPQKKFVSYHVMENGDVRRYKKLKE